MRSIRVGINGGGGDLVGTYKSKYLLLSVLDAFLSSVVVASAVITYWRTTWYLSDLYIFPKDKEISLIVSAVFGTVIQLIFTFGQEFLGRNLHPDKHRILFYVISRLYTYVYSIACINLWRGGWNALDFYSGTDPVHVIVPTVISLAVLAGMKTVRSLASAPFAVVLDLSKNYFEVPTMFRLTGSSEISLYMLDCFFSVFVIGSLVVFVWRGVWCLTDIFLFPENDKISALVSLVLSHAKDEEIKKSAIHTFLFGVTSDIFAGFYSCAFIKAIGYGLVIVIFSCQNLMERICEKLTGFRRIIIADIYVLISFIGTINLWRGIWNLINIYFLPEFPVWSCWITHLGSFIFLVLINCSNSILVRGVYMDGEDGGKCVVFPTFYLRLIFQEQRRRKIERSEVNHKISSLVTLSGDVEKDQKENLENSKVPIQKIETSEIKQ